VLARYRVLSLNKVARRCDTWWISSLSLSSAAAAAAVCCVAAPVNNRLGWFFVLLGALSVSLLLLLLLTWWPAASLRDFPQVALLSIAAHTHTHSVIKMYRWRELTPLC